MSNVRDFGAKGDGKRDDAEAIQHAVNDGDGVLHFPPGDYLLSRPILAQLAQTGRFAVAGSGGTAKILMAGAGPAFHVVGSHDKTAEPSGFRPEIWSNERLPTARGIEIEGRHAEASGFLLEGTMQPTFEAVLLRELRHGIHIRGRARNVLVSACHIYSNRGIGVFFDHVNLHQTIVAGSHISYCRQGGIKIVGSEIRNLQITGNDIEYNFDLEEPASADVWIDSSADGATVREGTIVSNTIQARYSPGGANIRMVGQNPKSNHKAGMFTIAGNLIGSQEVNVHLVACRGVVVSGNVIYSGHHRNLQIEGSRNIVCGSNNFDHNPDYGAMELCTGVRFVDSNDIVFSGSIVHDCSTGAHTVRGAKPIVRDGLVEIVRCRRINVSGCEVLDGFPHGLYVEDSHDVAITGNTLLETRAEAKTKSTIRWKGAGVGNFLAQNRIGKGVEKSIDADAISGLTATGNLES